MATKKPVAKKPVAKKTTPKKVVVKKPVAKKTPAKKTAAIKKKIDFTGMTPRQIADAKGEPWVSVVQVELDPDNIGNGAFELDWNDKFITNLVRSGYKGKNDSEMVDQWFQEVCRNVVAENFEQWEANQPLNDRPREIQRRDLGDGRSEIS
jgi:hypothetical protein